MSPVPHGGSVHRRPRSDAGAARLWQWVRHLVAVPGKGQLVTVNVATVTTGNILVAVPGKGQLVTVPLSVLKCPQCPPSPHAAARLDLISHETI